MHVFKLRWVKGERQFKSRPRVLTASLSFEGESQSVPRETLTETLADGKRYVSETHGVQLSVLPGTLKTPREAENLVELEPAARVLTCREKQYFAHLIMRQCGVVNKGGRKPLLFDSFIQNIDGNDVPSVSKILEEYQVLCDDGNNGWRVVERKRLSCVRDKLGALYLRAKIDSNFSHVACCKVMDAGCRYSVGVTQTRDSILLHNSCGADVFVVMMPTTFPTKLRESNSNVTAKGRIQGGVQPSKPRGWDEPWSKSIHPGESHFVRLAEKDQTVRLIMCTLEDCPPADGAPQTSKVEGSSSSALSSAPVKEAQKDSRSSEKPKEGRMFYWDSIAAYGGQSLAVLPKFRKGKCQKWGVVKGPGDSLARKAMSMSGLS